MKETIYISLMSIIICLLTNSCSCSNNQSAYQEDSFSPVGVYLADLTVSQSGVMTTIVIKSDGSATMQQDGQDVEYNSWSERYDGNAINIELEDYQGFRYGTLVMDFPSGYIYETQGAYNSKNPNQRNKFTKIR